jgi:cytochrome d ubiquinol oxidase subunit I
MRHAGPLIGMPFSLEGFAFFLEAIFLGLYLYGWNKLSRTVHMWTGLGVAVCGLLSAVFVTAVNAWMNDPAGFRFDAATGELVDIDPWAAMFNDAFPTQALHMSLAAYAAVSIAVLGIHAWALRRDPDSALHQCAFRIALTLALVSVPAQIFSGDLSAKYVAEHQPTKLAAAESLFHTQARAPLSLGGWPNPETQTLDYALELPGGLSFLAFSDFDAQVQGLDQVAREDWPPLPIVHVAFQLMVGCGFAMLTLVGVGALLWWLARHGKSSPPWGNRRYLLAAMLAAPLGLIAVEAGWVVTEVGRQPWIIRGVMRTADAVTPMPHLTTPFLVFSALYVFLGVIVIVLLRNHVMDSDRSGGDA